MEGLRFQGNRGLCGLIKSGDCLGIGFKAATMNFETRGWPALGVSNHGLPGGAPGGPSPHDEPGAETRTRSINYSSSKQRR